MKWREENVRETQLHLWLPCLLINLLFMRRNKETEGTRKVLKQVLKTKNERKVHVILILQSKIQLAMYVDEDVLGNNHWIDNLARRQENVSSSFYSLLLMSYPSSLEREFELVI